VTTEGVDYAGSRPDPVRLYAAGKRFVVRYGGPGGDWKHLTAAEARALSAAGLMIVANAEGSASGLLGGFDAGASWARQADQHFRSLGMPADRPIYLSVDFDADSGDWAELDAAMDGAASVIGRARVGVYGEYAVIDHFARNGKARWYWQTYAWSGGSWHPRAHIQQYRNGVTVAGTPDIDLDRAMLADYGQWTLNREEDEVALSEENRRDIRLLAAYGVADALAAGVARVQFAGITGPDARKIGNNFATLAKNGALAALAASGTANEQAMVDGVLAGLAAQEPEVVAGALQAVMSPEQALAVGQLLVQNADG
jgi:hypothetical protein